MEKHPETSRHIPKHWRTFHVKLDIETWAEFMTASPEEQRRSMQKLLREWEENRAREFAEDERRDARRGHWGD